MRYEVGQTAVLRRTEKCPLYSQQTEYGQHAGYALSKDRKDSADEKHDFGNFAPDHDTSSAESVGAKTCVGSKYDKRQEKRNGTERKDECLSAFGVPTVAVFSNGNDEPAKDVVVERHHELRDEQSDESSIPERFRHYVGNKWKLAPHYSGFGGNRNNGFSRV